MTEPTQPHTFGALPPPEHAWEEGKTAASIDFVRAAENSIQHLQHMIDRIKRGEEILTHYVHPDTIIAALQSP